MTGWCVRLGSTAVLATVEDEPSLPPLPPPRPAPLLPVLLMLLLLLLVMEGSIVSFVLGYPFRCGRVFVGEDRITVGTVV